MGTWGVAAFDNDDATDWMDYLEETAEPDLVFQALLVVADRPDSEIYMEEYARAVAAAELVASALGTGVGPLPERASDWLRRCAFQPEPDVVDLALRAVKTILGESEMRYLWMQGKEPQEWLKYMQKLENGLRSHCR